MKTSLSHRGVRTSEGVYVWPLRARSIAVEAAAADVPDNRPLSGRFADRSSLRKGQQLERGPRERWLVNGDVGPGHCDDDIAVNGDSPYRLVDPAEAGAGCPRPAATLRTVPSKPPLMMTGGAVRQRSGRHRIHRASSAAEPALRHRIWRDLQSPVVTLHHSQLAQRQPAFDLCGRVSDRGPRSPPRFPGLLPGAHGRDVAALWF